MNLTLTYRLWGLICIVLMSLVDEPIFIAVSKPLLTEFDIDHRMESCAYYYYLMVPTRPHPSPVKNPVIPSCATPSYVSATMEVRPPSIP